MDTDDSGSTTDNLYCDKAICLFNLRLIYLFLKKIKS